jgi:hypothetical protein
MSPVIASIILIVEALIAVGILLAAPTALGYGVYRALRGPVDSE